MDPTLVPRPAATVLALRDVDAGYEILMLRRNLRSDFVGGAYVFPGGGVDPGDAPELVGDLTYGLDDEAASARLGLDRGGLAYYVAALRELFEEAGLLLACDESGRAFEPADRAQVAHLAHLRRAVNERRTPFAEVLRSLGLLLDVRALAYLAHWVTPRGAPRRFDTRFFVARAPAGQVAAHDAGETVADTWLRPRDALAAHERGELEMILPTIRTLASIEALPSAGAVIEHAASQARVLRVEPRIIERDGRVAILTPGDDGYDQ